MHLFAAWFSFSLVFSASRLMIGCWWLGWGHVPKERRLPIGFFSAHVTAATVHVLSRVSPIMLALSLTLYRYFQAPDLFARTSCVLPPDVLILNLFLPPRLHLWFCIFVVLEYFPTLIFHPWVPPSVFTSLICLPLLNWLWTSSHSLCVVPHQSLSVFKCLLVIDVSGC